MAVNAQNLKVALSKSDLLLANLNPVRHVFFALLIAIYVLTIGQNWAVYTSALLINLWVKSGGRLQHVPFTIGGRRSRSPASDVYEL